MTTTTIVERNFFKNVLGAHCLSLGEYVFDTLGDYVLEFDTEAIKNKILDGVNEILEPYDMTLYPNGEIVGPVLGEGEERPDLEALFEDTDIIDFDLDEFKIKPHHQWSLIAEDLQKDAITLKTSVPVDPYSEEITATIWFHVYMDDDLNVRPSFSVWPRGERVYTTEDVWDWSVVEKYVPRSQWPEGTGDRGAGEVMSQSRNADPAVLAAVNDVVCDNVGQASSVTRYYVTNSN